MKNYETTIPKRNIRTVQMAHLGFAVVSIAIAAVICWTNHSTSRLILGGIFVVFGGIFPLIRIFTLPHEFRKKK
jgi:cell division protein FtsW (lipid II flippase)